MGDTNDISVRNTVIQWFRQNGRDLPWRKIDDPYCILISEVMLQQTQVDRVIPVYNRFIQQFPDFQSLARATTADVIRAWRGLGYNRRPVYLHRTARMVMGCHGARLPNDIGMLRKLPGVGEYTASAIACFAYRDQVPVIDANVERVLTRVFSGWESVTKDVLRGIALRILPRGKAWEWNQGLMDFGALICTARSPACTICVLSESCAAFKCTEAPLGGRKSVPRIGSKAHETVKRYEGSRRYYRGMIVRHLVDSEPGTRVSVNELGYLYQKDSEEHDWDWIRGLLVELSDEGILTLEGRHRQLKIYLSET
jgi:A/G-specific adenine glycosylase